jgi:hypothetical protein
LLPKPAAEAEREGELESSPEFDPESRDDADVGSVGSVVALSSQIEGLLTWLVGIA